MKFPKLKLLPTFIIASGTIFLLLTIIIIQIAEPLLKNNFLEEIGQNTVVFVNRLANTVLVQKNFEDYGSEESQKNFREFRRALVVPNLARLKIWNPEGVIIFSDESRLQGKKFANSFALEALDLSVKNKLINTLELAIETNEYAFDKGIGQVFDMAVPITFGLSRKPIGIVEVFIRTGPLETRIADFRFALATRIFIATTLFFIILTGIIVRASKTIRDQQNELNKYARELEEKVLERTKNLEESHRKENMLKDQFVFIISHELSTPVTAISWNISSLKKSKTLESLSPDAQEMFDNLEKNTMTLWRIIRNIVQIHRGELGKIQISKSEFDIHALAKEIIKNNQAFAQLKKVKLAYEDEGEPLTIKSDPERIKEVLNNLISNAIQFNGQGGKVNVKMNKNDSEIVFNVEDTGIGISEEEKPKVFEKFWRSEDAAKIEGSGLGLFISKFIVETMGGKIWFESKKAIGSTFSFSLPI
ncbi:MAG: HAMP domain-containing histidine kinase [Parcubacteria group bacterium]|nr:HAMP domain-containing histidine kinase [Parcubacteria group bacterium]